MGQGLRILLALAGLWLGSSCSLPYQPEAVEHSLPLPADAFMRVQHTLQLFYPRLAQVDAQAFRLQSEWLPHQRQDVGGFKRATVFLNEQQVLQVVVEVQYLRMGFDGMPHKTPVRGDRDLEHALAQALAKVL